MLYEKNDVRLYCGDALEVLKTLPDESIQMSITSPPYYGLRDYKVENQLGLEKTPLLYLEKLWAVFDEVKRVLKKDGVIFVNLGDTYGGSGMGMSYAGQTKGPNSCITNKLLSSMPKIGHSRGKFDKCLLMIPERFALGMIKRGWVLRNRICWYKRNAMPSSVKDRFTCTWEYVYFFSKSRKYYFDLNSIRIPLKQISIDRMARAILNDEEYDPKKHKHYDNQSENLMQVKHQHPMEILRNASQGYKKRWIRQSRANNPDRDELGNSKTKEYRNKTADQSYKVGGMKPCPEPNDPKYKNRNFTGRWGDDGKGMAMPEKYNNPLGRNPGDHWDITTKGFKGAHFAVYPEELCIKPILSGSKPGDIVLDSFCGSGTTGVVATKLGRKFWGIDLSEKYLKEIAIPRIEKEFGLFDKNSLDK